MKAAWTIAVAALSLAGTVTAQEPPAEPMQVPAGVTLTPVQPDAGTTRDDVRHDLAFARAAGTMTPDGEVGDTPEVLAAREAYHVRLREALLVEPDRDTALGVATETAIGMSGAEAIEDADVYEMTDDDGGLVGHLFVVEDDEAD
ncbi:MAG: DUF4148 domain-containing protein [Comamonadaceae bacterium]|nr:DUF4148 domain-containing protein [Comamonadaceae bacterium]